MRPEEKVQLGPGPIHVTAPGVSLGSRNGILSETYPKPIILPIEEREKIR
jgi:hypothetical protein